MLYVYFLPLMLVNEDYHYINVVRLRELRWSDVIGVVWFLSK